MANMRGDILLKVMIDDRACETETTYSFAGGGTVLTFSTVLPKRGIAAELISTYVGHPDTTTIATHLMLGPVGRAPQLHAADHPVEHLNPVEGARECAYDHAQQLIEQISAAGHLVRVELDEESFVELERVE